MDKCYYVYVSKDMTEDNWNDGEIGICQCITYNEFCNKEFSLEKALNKAFEIVFGEKIPFTNFKLTENDSKICYSRIENKNGEIPSEEELKIWKMGKINLYSSTYYFRVEIQHIASKEEFKQLGITEKL